MGSRGTREANGRASERERERERDRVAAAVVRGAFSTEIDPGNVAAPPRARTRWLRARLRSCPESNVAFSAALSRAQPSLVSWGAGGGERERERAIGRTGEGECPSRSRSPARSFVRLSDRPSVRPSARPPARPPARLLSSLCRSSSFSRDDDDEDDGDDDDDDGTSSRNNRAYRSPRDPYRVNLFSCTG